MTPKLSKQAEVPGHHKRNASGEAGQSDGMVSNILDNFDDIDSEEQSMFINLNIRNRRQKCIYNMSFETVVFDIYNPEYSSDEESSSSGSSATSSSGSCLDEEEEAYSSSGHNH